MPQPLPDEPGATDKCNEHGTGSVTALGSDGTAVDTTENATVGNSVHANDAATAGKSSADANAGDSANADAATDPGYAKAFLQRAFANYADEHKINVADVTLTMLIEDEDNGGVARWSFKRIRTNPASIPYVSRYGLTTDWTAEHDLADISFFWAFEDLISVS